MPTSKPYCGKYAAYRKADDELVWTDYHASKIPSGLDRLKVSHTETYAVAPKCGDLTFTPKHNNPSNALTLLPQDDGSFNINHFVAFVSLSWAGAFILLLESHGLICHSVG